jgi:hypothetical protein
MSLLTYNGVTLQLVKTNMVERIVNMSDDKTEYKWTDFIIDVNCIYNPAATSYTSLGQSPGNLPMTTDAAIRSTLMQPRAPLLFQEGGIAILNIATPLTQDCDNGPIPQSINISRIGSSRIFFMQYVVKCSIIECPVGGTISPIASNRYGRIEDIDDDYLSTIYTSGVAYFRSNVLNFLGNNADFYRAQLIPPAFSGYKRTHVNFSLDSNGTIVRWSTTDVEQKQGLGAFNNAGTAASIGITKMGLTTHVGALQGGPMGTASYGSMASVNCWAQGMKFVDRYAMLQFIVAVSFQKLQNVASIGSNLAKGEITEDVFNNRVEVSLSYVVLDDQDGFPGLFMPIQNVIGNQIVMANLPATQDNPQPLFSKGTRGTAAYMLAVSNFASSCAAYNPQDSTGQVVDPNSSIPGIQTGIGPQVQGFFDPGIPSPPSPQPSYRQKAKQNARSPGNTQATSYESAPIKSSNVNTSGIIQIPIASNIQNSSPGGSPGGGNPGSQNQSPSCVNIQLFQPTSKKIVEWSQTRLGAVPEVPDPVVPSIYSNNYTLLSNTVSTNSIEVMADASSVVYRASGVYSYSLLNPLSPGSSMQSGQYMDFPIPPWINATPSQFTQLQPGDFESNIINT